MGREIKRVPTDFNWELNKTWEGYLMPDTLNLPKCPDCERGYSDYAEQLFSLWYGHEQFHPSTTGSTPYDENTPEVRAKAERNYNSDPDFYLRFTGARTSEGAIIREAQRLAELFNGQWMHHLHQDDVDALVDSCRLTDFTHEIIPGEGWKKIEPPVRPSAEAVNRWSLNGFGHDSINAHTAVVERCKREGQPDLCPTCSGDGDIGTPEQRVAVDNWEPTEPPAGEGWQVWETVSEGSPITPVFADREGLIQHLMSNAYRWGISTPMTREQAEAFTADGHSVGSFISVGGRMIEGDKAVHELADKD